MLTLPLKQMVKEGVPVAAILLFWNLLAWVARTQNVSGPVGDAGLLMAALYVAVRGVALSERVLPPETDDVESILYENALLAVPAGVWFVGAMAFSAVAGQSALFDGFFGVAASALAGGGLGVVGLYVVAAGYATFDGGTSTGDDRRTTDDETPAEDGQRARDDDTSSNGASADD